MAVVAGANPGFTGPTQQMREMTADSDEMRQMSLSGAHPGLEQRRWGLEARTRPNVFFEEYSYWAKIERDMEEEEFLRYKAVTRHDSFLGGFKRYFSSNPYNDAKNEENDQSRAIQGTEETQYNDEKKAVSGMSPTPETHAFDAEWRQAARALRTAGWGAIFYLITTDILGWGQTPYVFSNTGYAEGVGVFVLMGVAAMVSAFMIWHVFLGLDSSRYPMLSYSDPFFRLCGSWARHFINFLQAIQFLLTVAVLTLGQTGVLAQLAGDVNLCFVACGIIVLVVGMASGYMRSLKHLGWFCNFSVWLNVISFIIICVGAAKFGPDPVPQVSGGILNPAWAKDPAPVKTFAGVPPPEYQPTDKQLFSAQFNGINSMVYAYSGAMFFPTFLAEMRHPWDFWRAAFLAQFFICVVYVFFGAFCYHFYGQYAYAIITQVVQPFSLQVVSNVLGLITGWLALFLYYNVAMKNIYLEVLEPIFKLPAISTKKGKYLWWGLGPIYFIIAFVLAMSVPYFNAFTNFVGGLFSINFTYSFSGIMFLAYKIQQYAALDGEGYDPATGVTIRHDSGFKRMWRGFVKGWMWTIPAVIYVMAGLAASGMGTWAALLALIGAAQGAATTSWSCFNPYYTG